MEQEKPEKTERFALFTLFARVCHPSTFVPSSATTGDVLEAAIEVHRDKGPGLLESIYEWCFTMEMQLRGTEIVALSVDG
ncbi:MAG: hypothetical protein NXI32_14635 [bacterium]|nr:hypothetical protein [bacterium]